MVARELRLLVKAGTVCNNRCDYCFDDIVGKARWLSPEIQASLYSGIAQMDFERVVVAWHGGEPLTAGMDFFRQATELQTKHLRGAQRCLNCVHTNGLLLNEHWGAFLADAGFAIGVSLDGPEWFHDRHRRTAAGGNSFQGLRRGLSCLPRNSLSVAATATVREDSWTIAAELYKICCEWEIDSLWVEPLTWHARALRIEPAPLTDQAWRRFLDELERGRAAVSDGAFKTGVPLLDEAADPLAPTGICWKDAELCLANLMVDVDGVVYPCDSFQGLGECSLGSLLRSSLPELLNAAEARSWRSRVRGAASRGCAGCGYHAEIRGRGLPSLSPDFAFAPYREVRGPP